MLLKIKWRLQIWWRYYFAKSSYDPKVFCIGYLKTGTSSLGKFLEMAGLRSLSFNRIVWRKFYAKGHLLRILKLATKFDAFNDLPWLKEDMIPILDRIFPGSKFIYLEREDKVWKESLIRWTFKKTGKYPDVEKEFEAFQNHRTFVLDYFSDRPEDILIMKISDKDAVNKISEFLNLDMKHLKMPHLNKSK